jgi:hypothetical protein
MEVFRVDQRRAFERMRDELMRPDIMEIYGIVVTITKYDDQDIKHKRAFVCQFKCKCTKQYNDVRALIYNAGCMSGFFKYAQFHSFAVGMSDDENGLTQFAYFYDFYDKVVPLDSSIVSYFAPLV